MCNKAVHNNRVPTWNISEVEICFGEICMISFGPFLTHSFRVIFLCAAFVSVGSQISGRCLTVKYGSGNGRERSEAIV